MSINFIYKNDKVQHYINLADDQAKYVKMCQEFNLSYGYVEALERLNLYRDKALDHLLWNLFTRCVPAPIKDKTIVLTGAVLGDGKGDWFLMLMIYKHLQKMFSDWTIRLIVVSSTIHKDQLHAPQVKALDLIYKGDNRILAPTFFVDPFPVEARILQKIQEAAAVIVGPICIYGLYDPLKQEMAQKSIALCEYDKSTNGDTISAKKELMGLSKESIGIFTNSTKEYTWQDVSNERLKQILFHDTAPSQIKINEYLSEHAFFLCYTHTLKSAFRFFLDAAFYVEAHAKNKSIDVCCPLNESLETEGNALGKRRFLQQGIIGTVEFISYVGDQKVEQQIKLREGGKKMRIIGVGLLSARDFKMLTQLSPLVGCTGDCSLAQVLSYGKIPFYDVRGHKKPLRDSLLTIVEETFGADSAIHGYIYAAAHEQETEAFLAKRELPKQARELGRTIREHYSVNSLLGGMVNELLWRRSDPAYAQQIDHLRQEYRDSKITMEELEAQLTQELHQRQLLST
jgi:hypothetical protein